MKVTCEYCESVVDADKNDTCPNCGAPLADSRKAKEAELREAQKKKEAYEREAREKQRKLEQERIEAERGKMILDAVTNVTGRAHSVRNSRALKAGCLIPIVVIALIIILSIAFSVIRQISGGSVDDLLSGVVSEKFSDYEETEAVPEKVEVNFGEKAITPMYTVLCDEIREVDSYPWTVQKGYRYVAVHLVLTNNLSEEESLNEKDRFCCQRHSAGQPFSLGLQAHILVTRDGGTLDRRISHLRDTDKYHDRPAEIRRLCDDKHKALGHQKQIKNQARCELHRAFIIDSPSRFSSPHRYFAGNRIR